MLDAKANAQCKKGGNEPVDERSSKEDGEPACCKCATQIERDLWEWLSFDTLQAFAQIICRNRALTV